MAEKSLPEQLRDHAEWLRKAEAWGNDSETTLTLLERAADALDSAWLIERYWNGRLLYWRGNPVKTSYGPDIKTGWSAKADEALRFSREEDAWTVLSWSLESEGRVARHVFGLRIPRGNATTDDGAANAD